MRDGFLRGSRYSPGNMDRQSLEALFVGRDDVMEDVLSRAMESIRGANKHYVLLVGPRGSGKTHLLALASHLLMDRIKAAKADDKVAVALLNEEEWGVASFLDFVVRILNALADQAPELNADIDDIHAKFWKDPVDAEAFAVERLQQHTHGKTLLLLCENLVDLFDGLGQAGQKRWRSIIQEDGNWAIVASTPSLFSAVALQDNPFYGFFTIRALNKIDFDTGVDLLAKKAVHEGKMELANFLHQPLGRARVRAIHHLAAGNYRAYVVLFDFLDKESLLDLVYPFMEMVDDLTPYYQDRMRQIPPAQRKIVEFLCRQNTPANVKDVATSCLMSHQTTAKQLGELDNAGFVTRNRIGRNTLCELSEPLMRICIEVKDNKMQHFKLFVEFLRHWFTNSELKKRHSEIERDDDRAQLDRLHVAEAVRRAVADKHDPVMEALSEEGMRASEAGDYHGLATIQEKLVRDGRGEAHDYYNWVFALAMQDDFVATIVAGREGASKYPEHPGIQSCLAAGLYGANRPVEALATIDKAIAVDPGRVPRSIKVHILLALERFEEAIQELKTALDIDPEHWQSFEQMVDAYVALKRHDDAEAYAHKLVQRASDDPDAPLVVARVYSTLGQLASALQIVDSLLDADPDNCDALEVRGSILCKVRDYDRAVVDRRRFVGLQPESALGRFQLANTLLLAGHYHEALDVAERLIGMDPTGGNGHVVRGIALATLGRQGDAVTAFDEVLATEDCSLLLLAATNVREFGDYASAHRYLGRVADLQPDNLRLWMERVRLNLDEGDLTGAADSAARIGAMQGRSMLGRLFMGRVRAATEPLTGALEALDDAIEPRQFEEDEELHFAAVVGILTRSLRSFGPVHLAGGLAKLRDLLSGRLEEGVIGRVLTDFLKENVEDGFVGPLEEWGQALDGIAANLADLSDCHIPVEMLRAAVTYSKTGDVKRLMSLPLEQRQLLESILPSDVGANAS